MTGGEPLSKAVTRRVPESSEPTDLLISDLVAAQAGVRAALELRSSEPLDPEVLEGHLSLQPTVEDLEIVDSGRGVLLIGSFAPSVTYRVRISEGLTGRDGSFLYDPVDLSVEARAPGPAIEIDDRRKFLELDAEGRLVVRTRGVQNVELSVMPVDEGNAVHILDAIERGTPLPAPTLIGRPTVTRWEAPSTEAVHQKTLTLPSFEDANVLKVSLRDSERPWLGIERWVLARGTHMVAKHAEGKVWVFLIDPTHGSPISGAEVRVRARGNQL
ncbi:MAG: hypothetical protein HC923_05050, partial [Myxococcales bacterium]|nr:hypothetical protein [Myxococcales bacterium]